MTHDDTRDRIIRARKAARLSRLGSLAGALGTVILVLGVVGFATGRTALGIIGVIVAVVLYALTVAGMRLNASVRRDPAVQQRSSRLRRARYRDAYPRRRRTSADDRSVES